MSNFFKIYRKKGFGITLKILDSFKNKESSETEFLKSLEKNNSYFNDFYRSKKDLIKYKLIGYKLDQEANKIIFLTQKGKKLLEKIDDIEDLILKDEDSPQAKDEDDEKKKE